MFDYSVSAQDVLELPIQNFNFHWKTGEFQV